VVFSGYSVSSTNKTDHHDITEILLKVTCNTINEAKPDIKYHTVATFPNSDRNIVERGKINNPNTDRSNLINKF